MTSLAQNVLFDTGTSLPNGFVYRPDFLTENEERELLAWMDDLPLSHSRLGEYVAKRRIVGFGWGYDFRKEELVAGPPLPPFLRSAQRKIAKWLDIPVWRVAEALITEYPKGAAIGWHRDNEKFDISLVFPCLVGAACGYDPFLGGFADVGGHGTTSSCSRLLHARRTSCRKQHAGNFSIRSLLSLRFVTQLPFVRFPLRSSRPVYNDSPIRGCSW
jgi:hypothetical protein